jgi:hypothetical protein
MQQMDITNNGLKLLLLLWKQKIKFSIWNYGSLTEVLLIVNLAIRGHDIQKEVSGEIEYPDSSVLLWDNENIKISNFDNVNQFVKRNYRKGWKSRTVKKSLLFKINANKKKIKYNRNPSSILMIPIANAQNEFKSL